MMRARAVVSRLPANRRGYWGLGWGRGAHAYACDDNNTGASESETTLMIWFSFAAVADGSMSDRMNYVHSPTGSGGNRGKLGGKRRCPAQILVTGRQPRAARAR